MQYKKNTNIILFAIQFFYLIDFIASKKIK